MRHTKFQASSLKVVTKGLMTLSIAIVLNLASSTTSKALAANLSTSQPSTAQPSTIDFSASQPQQIAQVAFINQVRDRLIRIGEYFIKNGYALTHEPSFDKLQQGQSQWINFKLRSGTSYVFSALGDQDCQDLDLEVYDENNNLVGRDAQTDGTPVISVTPSWTGNFKVKVTLAQTKAAYSYYGLTAYGK